jgi:adenylate cyclase class 2
MAIEIEKKYRVNADQLSAVIAALNEDGAILHGDEYEVNIIYGGPPLDPAGAVVRIRKTSNGSLLTYKRRIEDHHAVKQQIEYESAIADPDEVDSILTCLGLVPRLIYEKRRQTWKYLDVEVVLDELPFGTYIEIEGPMFAITEAELRLGMEDLEVENETYPRLTMRYGKLTDGIIESRFGPKG